MKEELISFETAKLAKENGFDIECLNFYTRPSSKMFGIDEKGGLYNIKNTPKKLYTCGEHAALNMGNVFFAPTLSLLQKWLRDEHGIYISINHRIQGSDDNVKVSYTNNSEKGIRGGIYYDTYEEALESGLKEGLKLIEKKQ